jgi:hypothetical protein
MMTTSMACEQCAQEMPAEGGVYSTAGKLICPSCVAADQMGAATARIAASARRTKILLGVTAFLVTVVPTVLFALGLGRLVGQALFWIGVAVGGFGAAGLRVSQPSLLLRDTGSDGRASVARMSLFLLLFGVVVGGVGALIMGTMDSRPSSADQAGQHGR